MGGERCRIEEISTKTITCKNCGSEAVVKFGSYKGEYKGTTAKSVSANSRGTMMYSP